MYTHDTAVIMDGSKEELIWTLVFEWHRNGDVDIQEPEASFQHLLGPVGNGHTTTIIMSAFTRSS
jgi:hypothetical protein